MLYDCGCEEREEEKWQGTLQIVRCEESQWKGKIKIRLVPGERSQTKERDILWRDDAVYA